MVTEMIEKAIEIEGLLRIIRDGEPLPETYRMLKAKVKALEEEVNDLEEKRSSRGDMAVHADIVIAAPAAAMEKPQVVFSDAPAELPSDELELTEEDDIILAFDEGLDASNEPEYATEPVIKAAVDTSAEPSSEESRKQIARPPEEKTAMPKREKKLKSAFSLNDRFLYARELFGGDMKMFDSALDFIEGVNDYSVIEDYFFNEMEWDPDKEEVKSFMELLRNKI